MQHGQNASIDATRHPAGQVDEHRADVVDDHPRRFCFFATLVLPYLEGALTEARHTFDVLGADGVVLLTNVDGVYVGSPDWDPLLELLDEHRAVVFVHPTALACPPAAGMWPIDGIR
ncbi:amidohydrolase family protein [Streptomyces hokutonensis]|uniref:amidohydrolase family protein n=1 Tax=Streptomyces hokutonensis TaxID=1306990 RepID=UPI00380670BB